MFKKRTSLADDKHVRWSKRLTSIGIINGFKKARETGTGVQNSSNPNENEEEFTWARKLSTKREIEKSYKLWSKELLRQEFQTVPSDTRQLIECTLNGKQDVLEDLIAQSKDPSTAVNSCDSKGRSLLHLAAVLGNSEIVTYLLKQGARVTCWDTSMTTTPLICACARGSLQIIEVLYSHGADVNESSGKTGRTPLHWAVASGQFSCVQKLIEFGALEIVTDEAEMISPFLLAAILGHEVTLEFLIENGADVSSSMGKTCDSALHLVSTIENAACTKTLLEAGVSPDVRNIFGETPLHLTESVEIASLLLSKGANVNATEINGMTPLHMAVLRGNANLEKIKLLISHKAEVNAQNERGETPLFLAAMEGAAKKVCYLLRNGANVTVKNNEGIDSYEIMKSKTPHVIPNIQECFDKAITVVSKDPSDFDCTVSLDFSEIGMEADKEITSARTRNRNSKIVDMSSEDFEANLRIQQPRSSLHPGSTLNKSPPNETEFLHRLILDEHKDILAHPLIQSFLALKWRKARFVFYSDFVFYIFVAVLYTIFIMESFMKSCPQNILDSSRCNKSATETYDSFMNNVQPTSQIKRWAWFSVTFQSSYSPPDTSDKIVPMTVKWTPITNIQCDISWQVLLVWCVLILSTLTVIVKEILKIFNEPTKYLKAFENVGEWIFIISIFATSVWSNFAPCRCCNISEWHYPTAAVGLLIAWAMILVRIGKFPQFGLYVQMLGKVLKNFGGFLLVYVSILNAFALAFCVLFPKEPAFRSYPLAMIKVFTMMTGEMGYDELFYGEYFEDRLKQRQGSGSRSISVVTYALRTSDEMSQNGTQNSGSGSGTSDSVPERPDVLTNDKLSLIYKICTSHLLYCLFVAVVSISLMNLLVALAVSDIQDLQRKAKVDRLCKQARSIVSLERLVFAKILTRWIPPPILSWLRNMILLQPSTQRCKFTIRPNDPTDLSVSEDLKKKIMAIAVRSFEMNGKETTSVSVWSESENESNEPKPLQGNGQTASEGSVKSFEKLIQLQDQLDSLQAQVDVLSKTLVGQMESVLEILNLMQKE